MDKQEAWRKFSKSGSVGDYLEFRNCARNGAAGANRNENEHRRSGAEGDGHGGK